MAGAWLEGGSGFGRERPVSVCRSTYQGDQVLARMLRKAGAELTVAGARDLVAGVLAAPEDRDAGLWAELVVPSPSPALRAQLVALKAEMKRARDDDLKRDSSPDERLGTLRAELARRELSGFIVPRADEHQGEWVPPRAERLAWLTGFTGSAGVAVVLAEPAALFVDGRYTLQVRAQVDERLYAFQHLTDSPPDGWIARNLSSGGRLGYDPWLHTQAGLARLREACAKADAELVVCADNPLDAVWTDQPPPPIAPVVPHELGFAGRNSAEKREELAAKLTGEGVEAAVLTAKMLADSLAEIVTSPSVTVTPVSALVMYAETSLLMLLCATDTPIDMATPVPPKPAAREAAPVMALIAEVSLAMMDMEPAAIPVVPSPSMKELTVAEIRLKAVTPAPDSDTPVPPAEAATDPAITRASMDWLESD